MYISGWRAGAPPVMTRAGDRYSPGCLLERCQQYPTLHTRRCGHTPKYTHCTFAVLQIKPFNRLLQND
ncbi:hypothetical protein Y032_0022g558 [Ancylostoma ceylanicum]|uniref:Uncharacterized protein n=1 Tax=Ancylostoma ceylanicum TaxID=53326 RepID=A0A016UZ59_9BILA|nr:hypothetical protein Y032_0022g558 [Ancylostoma ceylanicum]